MTSNPKEVYSPILESFEVQVSGSNPMPKEVEDGLIVKGTPKKVTRWRLIRSPKDAWIDEYMERKRADGWFEFSDWLQTAAVVDPAKKREVMNKLKDEYRTLVTQGVITEAVYNLLVNNDESLGLIVETE